MNKYFRLCRLSGIFSDTHWFINEYLWSCCNKTLLLGTEIHISYDFPVSWNILLFWFSSHPLKNVKPILLPWAYRNGRWPRFDLQAIVCKPLGIVHHWLRTWNTIIFLAILRPPNCTGFQVCLEASPLLSFNSLARQNIYFIFFIRLILQPAVKKMLIPLARLQQLMLRLLSQTFSTLSLLWAAFVLPYSPSPSAADNANFSTCKPASSNKYIQSLDFKSTPMPYLDSITKHRHARGEGKGKKSEWCSTSKP